MLGLSPITASNQDLSFIFQLKKKGVIDKQEFTIFFGEPWSIIGFAEFGSTSYSFKYATLPNLSRLWKLRLRDVSLTGSINAAGVVFDSSASWIYLPRSDFELYKNQIFGNFAYMGCQDVDGQIICNSCKRDDIKMFPSISISLGNIDQGVKLEMKGPAHISANATVCYSQFRSSPDLDSKNYWVLGAPIYKAFIINHDNDNQRMGFAVNSGFSDSSVTQLGPITTTIAYVAPVQATRALSRAVSGLVAVGTLIALY